MTVVDNSVEAASARIGSPIRTAFDDALPFALALIPFGIAVGGTSAAVGLSAPTALFGAVVLLAGAAQLAALETIGSGGGVIPVVIVAGLVNLRFIFYGAGVASWFASLPIRRRLVLAFPVVDQTFILCQQRFADVADLGWRQRYYLTGTSLLASAFVLSQVIGFYAGANLPEALGLHLAAPLAFAGLLASAMKTRRDVMAGAIAAVVVIGGTRALGPAALPIAVFAGVAGAGPWRASTAGASTIGAGE